MNKITVEKENRNAHTTFRGFVDGKEVISISNNINGLYWTIGSSSCLPSDFAKAKAYSDCISKTIEAAESNKIFKRGDRVVVNNTAGFNKGAHGVVEYVEPSGKLWVLRDGSSSACYYLPTELDFE